MISAVPRVSAVLVALRSLARTGVCPFTRTRGRSFAAALFVAMALSGCGNPSPTATPAASGASGPPIEQTASPSPAGTESSAASPSARASSNPTSTGSPAGDDLLAELPGSLDGQALARFSVAGADFVQLAADAGAAGVREFLGLLGRSPRDLSAAVAIDQSGAIEGEIAAIRVARVSGDSILAAFVAAERHAVTGGVMVTARTLGGKRVTVVTGKGDAAPAPAYVYARGEILFLVQATDPAVASAALAALP